MVSLLEDDGRAPFIGLSQGGAAHLALPQRIEFASLLVEAKHQVPQTAQAGQLPVEPGHQMRPIGEGSGFRPLPGMGLDLVVGNMFRY